jgi:hypothetical protein
LLKIIRSRAMVQNWTIISRPSGSILIRCNKLIGPKGPHLHYLRNSHIFEEIVINLFLISASSKTNHQKVAQPSPIKVMSKKPCRILGKKKANLFCITVLTHIFVISQARAFKNHAAGNPLRLLEVQQDQMIRNFCHHQKFIQLLLSLQHHNRTILLMMMIFFPI